MKYILLLMTVLLISSVHAQQSLDSLQRLNEVTVEAERIDIPVTGTALDTVDEKIKAIYSSTSVADLIASSGKIFVKTYGPGTLSSLSLNGTTPTQTNILWNGFKIESPMVGQTDVALLPVFFTDEVVIQSGGRSDSWGSGSMAGSILLNNSPFYNSGLSVIAQATLGSYNDRFYSSKAEYGSKNYSGNIAWFNHESENNFEYKDFSHKYVNRENAGFKEEGIISNHFLNAGPHTFSLHAWLQHSDRELPASVTESPSNASQTDNSIRAVGSWKYGKGNFTSELRSGINTEQLIYKKYEADSSDFFTSSSRAESKYNFHQNQFLVAIDYNYSKANEKYYSETPTQQLFAATASWKKEFKKIKLDAAVNARMEWIDGKDSPFVPSLGIEKKLPFNLQYNLSVARVYRNTTMNERYWNPGGNPELLPESGWSFNTSLYHNYNSKFAILNTSLEYFDNNISNQVVWMGSTIYSPVNVLSVHSYGFTAREKITIPIRQIILEFSGAYTNTKSINTKVAESQKASLDKQAIYVPIHQGSAFMFLSWKKLMVNYEQVFTGSCYVQSDNLGSLPAWTVANAGITFKIPYKKLSAELGIRVKNIFNENYYVINYFPMPFRTYNISVIINFNSKKQSHNEK
jgi:vitamin B12 transporter